jgi:hypothetical protein
MAYHSTNSEIMFAAGTADIMPTDPLPLGGYDRRTSPYQSIAEPLEANVLVSDAGQGEFVVVTLDLLYPGEVLRDRILQKAGLAHRPEALFLAASHTHFAPMTQYGTPPLGMPVDSYIELVASRVAQLVEKLRHRLAEASLTYCEGLADYSINRRLRRLRLSRSGLRYSADLGPNPNGPRDPSVRVLRVADIDGRVVALIWNYACHPTGFPDRQALSAEYPAVVRRKLRTYFGDVPVLFLQGFSGDLRPPFRANVRSLRSLAVRMASGPQFGAPNRTQWETWAESLGSRVVEIAKSEGQHLSSNGGLTAGRDIIPIEQIAAGDSQGKAISIHALRLGGARLVGFGAEPVNAYREIVERKFGTNALFTAGCIDQTHCYLPTDAMLAEGGYEVEGFRPAFDFKARFKSGLEAAVSTALERANTGKQPKTELDVHNSDWHGSSCDSRLSIPTAADSVANAFD